MRNWDYRYCWLRDATITLERCCAPGTPRRRWPGGTGCCARSPATRDLQIMYGLAGERRLTEWEADWLPGYEGSAPVRIGNAAWPAPARRLRGGHGRAHLGSPPAWRRTVTPGRCSRPCSGFLERHWTEPDEGIWEVRGPRRHFTHSKVMAWVAFDRAVKAVEQFGPPARRPVAGGREPRCTRRSASGLSTPRGGLRRSLRLHRTRREPPCSFCRWWVSCRRGMSGSRPRSRPCRTSCARTASCAATVPVTRAPAADGAARRRGRLPRVQLLAGGQSPRWPAAAEEAVQLFERLAGLRNDVALLAEEMTRPGGAWSATSPRPSAMSRWCRPPST